MKTTLKLYAIVILSAVLAFTFGTASAEDYIYRDLMANTLPSSKCLDKPEAVANAQDGYLPNKKEKVFCETQGYGWNLVDEKDAGKLVCQACNDDKKYQCHLQDIVVACKRIKPGSVGMIPGKG